MHDIFLCLLPWSGHRLRGREPDGRFRFWGEVTRPGERFTRVVRVVTLEDGETIHNAFFDRSFRIGSP